VPEGRVSPLKARLSMQSGAAPVSVEFDFLQTGEHTWWIEVDTDAAPLRLDAGGDVLTVRGNTVETSTAGEYPGLYRRFADLIAEGKSDVDARPLQLGADAFLPGERRSLPPFGF